MNFTADIQIDSLRISIAQSKLDIKLIPIASTLGGINLESQYGVHIEKTLKLNPVKHLRRNMKIFKHFHFEEDCHGAECR